ncbi:hypothetical protein SAY87_019347 [Trapa incisa]|uniref:Uncharacterized protein n=1 Tax=Trapa incisa TaxID=236973 RepID=A0AAN7K482_9MYRT|nr:hypothetical protein SAY87_019347 [Trapa incisa]
MDAGTAICDNDGCQHDRDAKPNIAEDLWDMPVGTNVFCRLWRGVKLVTPAAHSIVRG